MSIERRDITPAQASAMLLRNTGNRALRRGRVAAYASDMRADKFDGGAVHIQIAPDGNIMNGQHTLTAIVESGVTLRGALVETDCDPSRMNFIDRGLPRSLSDALGFAGATQTAALAAILRPFVLFTKYPDKVWSGPSIVVTQAESFRVYEQRPEFWDRVVIDSRRLRDNTRINASAFGVVMAAADCVDSGNWQAFYEGVISGANLGDGDPRLTLRNWATRPSEARQDVQYRVVCITRAWNAWVKDEPLKILKWPGRNLPMPKVLSTSEAKSTDGAA